MTLPSFLKLLYLLYCIVADISFNETAYSTTEDSGLVQPVLVLSIPSSFDITVQVTDKNSTAIGKKLTFS